MEFVYPARERIEQHIDSINFSCTPSGARRDFPLPQDLVLGPNCGEIWSRDRALRRAPADGYGHSGRVRFAFGGLLDLQHPVCPKDKADLSAFLDDARPTTDRANGFGHKSSNCNTGGATCVRMSK
ncbi:hypothetical protein HPB48_014755 [Haemaphysalis longicornis]|uniref:Uncharacterized protein n=1 Tax=Haemaphysalis longicornis TaxID=44386 RepID=A0A9J6FXV7_HAELO|nr:hypothetical protein HPB48_014755 [Haemaphysalis longicornis]